jgi:hypothetical protein
MTDWKTYEQALLGYVRDMSAGAALALFAPGDRELLIGRIADRYVVTLTDKHCRDDRFLLTDADKKVLADLGFFNGNPPNWGAAIANPSDEQMAAVVHMCVAALTDAFHVSSPAGITPRCRTGTAKDGRDLDVSRLRFVPLPPALPSSPEAFQQPLAPPNYPQSPAPSVYQPPAPDGAHQPPPPPGGYQPAPMAPPAPYLQPSSPSNYPQAAYPPPPGHQERAWAPVPPGYPVPAPPGFHQAPSAQGYPPPGYPQPAPPHVLPGQPMPPAYQQPPPPAYQPQSPAPVGQPYFHAGPQAPAAPQASAQPEAALDSTGWERGDQPGMWIDPKTGAKIGLEIKNSALTEPYWLEDLEWARRELAKAYGEMGCLIEAEPIWIGQAQGMAQIFKVPHPGREKGLLFGMSLFLAKSSQTVIVKYMNDEGPVTGVREAMAMAQLGIPFTDHPYAPGLNGKLPYNRTDDASLDFQFPDHPLTQARQFLRVLDRRLRLNPTFVTLPDFRGTTRS